VVKQEPLPLEYLSLALALALERESLAHEGTKTRESSFVPSFFADKKQPTKGKNTKKTKRKGSDF
jgi:hypothetical protein